MVIGQVHGSEDELVRLYWENGEATPESSRVPKLRSPAKVLMTLRQGIEFGAADDEPVDILLAVLWPQDHQDGFLPALAKYCRLFRSNQVLQGLRNARSKTEAMMVL
ncbi:PTS sugar transporter subunit IIA [Sinorhizobium sp. BJ1]|uniref:PTS sugar transporter subunit IIA n=1 Tax=Sinorhizobium sp. BJ1 TaxID=2035455 RepID=UPI001FE111FD|nr:PTS sugar transporter subunit IIA [Sinorhizobium sp. BJ1]